MERNKRGISLIVLVITIIVMIVLAGAVIISLGNSGIIGMAQDAVDKSNEQEVEQLAALIWSETYLDMIENGSKIDETTLASNVKTKLEQHGITEDDYIINVTASGVVLTKISTLGDLITDPTVDFGKLVDYTVTTKATVQEYNEDGDLVDVYKDVTHSDWQVFYEDEKNGYVFLISKDVLTLFGTNNSVNTVSNLTAEHINIYDIFKLGQEGYMLSSGNTNSDIVAAMIGNYSTFANTGKYGGYVVGAIGGPTIELLAAGYNAKHPNSTPQITPIVDRTYEKFDEETMEYECYGAMGYFINHKGGTSLSNLIEDEIYILADYEYPLASPSAECDPGSEDIFVVAAGQGRLYAATSNEVYHREGSRPIVCLKSDIPAIETDNGYSLLK